MIRSEIYEIKENGIKLYKTYSDEQYKIQQVDTGYIYDEAIDIENSIHTYIETTEKIILPEELEG